MSSRVISGSKIPRVEPVHWLNAYGEAVNAPASPENAEGDAPIPASVPKVEMEGALLRIHVLERRIQELEAELPRRYESGRRDGFTEGERRGAESAGTALQPLLERFSTTIAELASFRARFRRDSEPELLRLALAVARRILRRELTVDPHSLLGILKAALATINQAEVLCVRAAPEDAAHLNSRLAELGLPDPVEIVADRALVRGSVILDTKRGQIDASVNTQLSEIENGFADRIGANKGKERTSP